MVTLLLGFIFSTTIAMTAYAKRSLNDSGAMMAIMLGTIIYGAAGWFAFLYLILFFLSSTVLGRFAKEKKPSNRNGFQVFANGGLAALFAVLHFFYNSDLYYILFFLSVTISASDTWSSEIGRLSKKLPRHIFTYKVMQAGLSGGVTLLGFFGSILASIIFALLSWIVLNNFFVVLLVAGFGILGSIIDSMLGTIQVKYLNEGNVSEDRTEASEVASGVRWLSNNLVNFFANLFTILLFVVFYTGL